MPANRTTPPPPLLRVCEQCGKVEARKTRRGLCQSCYRKEPDQRQKLAERLADRTTARTCSQCGKVVWKPTRRGLCAPCYMRLPRQHAKSTAARYAKVERRRALGVCVICGRERRPGGLRCPSCYEQQYARSRRYRQALKDKVYAHYGGYVCTCCGETEPHFLSLDHVDGGGTRERRRIKLEPGAGQELYLRLAREGFRTDLRVLCHNCNRGRWLNGGECPHVGRR